MLSYELGYWWADSVIEIYEGLSYWISKQVFVSELTENLYFSSHLAVKCLEVAPHRLGD